MIRDGIWHKKARKVKSRRWRKRKECFGALIQLDGSQHDWFEGRRDKCSLLLFIDDATSEVVWLEFNEYLRRVYMPKHNRRFSVEAESPVNMHRSIDGFDLDNILCLREERVLTNDWTITYKTRYLQLHKDQKAVLFPKNKITVHEHLDGTLKLFIRNIGLDFTILPERPQKRVIERQPKELPQPKKPAADHPWRKGPSCNTQRSDKPRVSNALSR